MTQSLTGRRCQPAVGMRAQSTRYSADASSQRHERKVCAFYPGSCARGLADRGMSEGAGRDVPLSWRENIPDQTVSAAKPRRTWLVSRWLARRPPARSKYSSNLRKINVRRLNHTSFVDTQMDRVEVIVSLGRKREFQGQDLPLRALEWPTAEEFSADTHARSKWEPPMRQVGRVSEVVEI